MRYGLTWSAMQQRFRGCAVPYHVARVSDIVAANFRLRTSIRGLCGAVIVYFYNGESRPPAPLCQRCAGMSQ